jgi:hypothetical protein
MLEVKAVNNKKMRKEFVEFPLKLYKDNPYFVPPLYLDEMNVFTEKNVYDDICEHTYFLAYRDGEVVGRISGIIQKDYNLKNNEKRARFTRFDAIDDVEVAKALFDAAEDWAKSKGMDTVCGPLGFSDLEREGLLIDGFDYLSTFEEQYNYPYYQDLIEACGYVKDVDWVEYRLYTPKERNEKVKRIAELTLKKYNLTYLNGSGGKKAFIEKYKDQIFNVLDETYKHLYGTVPFTEAMKKQIIDQFMLVIKPELVCVVADKDENVIAFGLAIPGFGHVLQKSGGRLTLPTIIRLLKAVNKPKTLELGLIGVMPSYQATGVNAIILDYIMEIMIKYDVMYTETNLNLETNTKVQSQWKFFDKIQHKKRRSYIKKLD